MGETKRKLFCDNKCSMSFHWTLTPEKFMRPKKIKECKKCKNKLYLKQRTFCEKCWIDISKDINNKTKAEINRRLIAYYARQIMSKKEKICKVCGYSLHVEVCHIKAVKDFPLTAKMSEVNSLENLIYLCPNHHWEFDRGRLIL